MAEALLRFELRSDVWVYMAHKTTPHILHILCSRRSTFVNGDQKLWKHFTNLFCERYIREVNVLKDVGACMPSKCAQSHVFAVGTRQTKHS